MNMQADRSPHRKHMSAEGLSYHVVRVWKSGRGGGGWRGGLAMSVSACVF